MNFRQFLWSEVIVLLKSINSLNLLKELLSESANLTLWFWISLRLYLEILSNLIDVFKYFFIFIDLIF